MRLLPCEKTFTFSCSFATNRKEVLYLIPGARRARRRFSRESLFIEAVVQNLNFLGEADWLGDNGRKDCDLQRGFQRGFDRLSLERTLCAGWRGNNLRRGRRICT
jgi:hypothetical protein